MKKKLTKLKKNIVGQQYLCVGRSVNLSEKIYVGELPYDFICTQGINLTGDNVKFLSINIDNTHDYMMASDYVITKSGWSTAQKEFVLENLYYY